jgi:hypothetical protein
MVPEWPVQIQRAQTLTHYPIPYLHHYRVNDAYRRRLVFQGGKIVIGTEAPTRQILIAAVAITFAAYAQPQPTPVLSQDQVLQLEIAVSRNPGDLASQTLLGKNYAFFILGITSLAQFDQVATIDPGKAAGDFARRAQDELGKSLFAGVVAEGGQALWRYSTEVQVYQELHRSPVMIDTTRAKTLGVQSLDRAISMDPKNATWRAYRIPILMSRSNFNIFMPLTATEAYRQLKQDMPVLTGSNRYNMLADAAKLAVKVSEWDDARGYAQELLKSSNDSKNWNYGNAIFFANMVLGQVALRRESVDSAKAYLLAAGKTPGSPQLNSFGPNMSLAKDLFEAGEREAVLTFFDECRVFWKMDRGRLKEWADEINSNRMPDFGANLVY